MPAFVDNMFALMKSFMKPKMRERIQLHGKELESLHEAVGTEVLPKEYGGTNGTIQEHIGMYEFFFK